MGRSIPVGRLTVDRLRDAVRTVLGDPAYRERAGRLRSSIEAADGLNRAADLIEGAFGTGRRASPTKERAQLLQRRGRSLAEVAVRLASQTTASSLITSGAQSASRRGQFRMPARIA